MTFRGPEGRSRRRWPYAVLAVAIVVALVVVLLVVPISHGFSFQPVSTSCGGAFDSATYPSGAHVTGSWAAASTAFPADVSIHADTGAVIYGADGTNGSFSFTANGGNYSYEVLPGTQQHVGCGVAPMVTILGTWSATTWQSAGL